MITTIRSVWNWLFGVNDIGVRDGRSYRIRRFKAAYLWWLYPAIALYTFGYNATTYPVYEFQTYDETKRDEPKVISPERTGPKALMSGLLWPLYWTWELMADEEAVAC